MTDQETNQPTNGLAYTIDHETDTIAVELPRALALALIGHNGDFAYCKAQAKVRIACRAALLDIVHAERAARRSEPRA